MLLPRLYSAAARRRAGYEKTPYVTPHSASHETSQKHMHLTAQDHNTEPAGVRILHSVLTYHSTRLIRWTHTLWTC